MKVKCKEGETSDYSDDEYATSMYDAEFHHRLDDYDGWHYGQGPTFRMGNPICIPNRAAGRCQKCHQKRP